MLAICYHLGLGVAQAAGLHDAEAVRLLGLAIAQGKANAQSDWRPRRRSRFFFFFFNALVYDSRAQLSCERAYVSKTCSACGATRKLKTCARCQVARFCGPACVRTAWAEHKPHCEAWEAEARAAVGEEEEEASALAL